MEQITPEIKAKIFALYWGQEIMVWFYTGGEKAKSLCKVAGNHMKSYYIERGCLEVKPLSSITDEDAIEVAKLMGWNRVLPPNTEGHPLDFSVSVYDFNWIKNKANDLSKYPIQVTDYLRSKGYALPAFGYSVDELVEAGVFKLKGVNND